MRQVLADFSVSISALKKNPSALLAQASGSPIAVLNHNKPAAYLIPAETYVALCAGSFTALLNAGVSVLVRYPFQC